MSIKVPLCSVILCTLLLSGGARADHALVGIHGGLAGPITTTTAVNMAEGRHSFNLGIQYIDFDAVSDEVLAEASENDEDVHSTDSLSRTAINYAFGFSEKLTFGLALPYIQRKGLKEATHEDEHHEDEEEEEEHHDESGVTFLGDAGGLGDLQVFGVYGLGDQMSDSRSALIFGLKTPTGKTDARGDNGELLEVELQPGSGSWDVFLGLTYSSKLGAASLDTNVLYTIAHEGTRETTLGDILNYNLSLAWPLTGGEHRHTVDAGLDHHDDDVNVTLVFEVNGEWRDRVDIAGETQENTGGNLIYFSPGVKLTSGNWVAGVAVGIPYVELNGIQSEPKTRFILSVGRTL